MTSVFMILIALAVAAVVASLLAGLFVMARGGDTDRKYSNKLMQARVVLQGVAILLFILAVLSTHQ